VIPCYNGENVIKKCFDSIVSQIDSRIEVIIINNGSQDNTKRVVSRLVRGKKNFKFISLRNNVGVSGARNYGLDRSNGQYVMLCDCDDQIPANSIEKIIAVVSETDADIIAGNYEEYKGSFLSKRTQIEKRINKYESLMDGHAVWNKVYKKEMLDRYNIRFKNYNYGEDTLFLAESIQYAKNIELISDVIYRRVVSQEGYGQLTRTFSLGGLHEYVESGIDTYSIKYDEFPDSSVHKIHIESIRFVFRYYWMHLTPLEKEKGFEDIKRFVTIHEWDDDELSTLNEIFGVDYDTLKSIGVVDYVVKYLCNNNLTQLSNMVLDSYNIHEAMINALLKGEVSMENIIKYNGAWIIGKTKNRRK